MLVSLRREYGQLITSGGQLLLLFVGAKLESRPGWLACLALMALVSVFAWTSAFRRARAVVDTPTSKIASAAQGYVELRGAGKPFAGTPVLSPLTGLPCLWFRYRVERRNSDNKWVQESSGESDASFILDDGSGQCLVDPEGAEMLVSRRDTWTRDDHRYTEWLLLEHDSVYALGDFSTRGSVDLDLDASEDVKALLAEWKKKPEALLARFDLNKDGTLDMKEWELARRQARREVAQAQHETRQNAEVNILHVPEDDRMYLISDLEPDSLASKYRLWAWLHLAIFFGALIAFAIVWRARF
jgi:hypothetical protein